jgi:hypothetical protein
MRSGQLLTPGDDGGARRPEQPDYLGPPPTAAHDPATAPQPWQQYGYPPPYPYAYGYPQPDPAEIRPSAVTAAAVLGYISGGLLVLAAMIVFTGASLVAGIDNSTDAVNLSTFTIELTFDGLLNLLCAGLLTAGGVLMTGRRVGGRTMYSVAAALVAIEAVYWLARWGTVVDAGQSVVAYALLFGALAVTGLVLAWRSSATQWFERAPQRPYSYR